MTDFLCRTGVRHVIRADRPTDRPSTIQRVGIRRSVDILPGSDNPKTDADVIMTAAVVGYAAERLKAGKNCRFDYEVDAKDPKKSAEDKSAHVDALLRINQALQDGGVQRQAELGETPVWQRGGRITGGTGDRDTSDQARYQPPTPRGISKQLFDLAAGDGTVEIGGRSVRIEELLGYQGRGAYTGFIDGRSDGQTGLMSTFRFRAAGNDPAKPEWGLRWIPADPRKAGGAPIGTRDAERIWGMIGDNAVQSSLALEGMYFQDSDAARGGTGLTTDDVAGYIHGMIQAIYDVRWRRTAGEEVTPYEIAVGRKTTKLASCIPCSFFMEATGFPASSTHLGRGESWCILHPTEQDETPIRPIPDTGAARRRGGDRARRTLGAARSACNDEWAAYCRKILTSGAPLIARSVTDDHLLSFDALQALLERFEDARLSDYAWANLILDALTIHESEYKRVTRTLKLRPSGSPDRTGLKTSKGSPDQITQPCPHRTATIKVEIVSVDDTEEQGPKVNVRLTPAPDAGNAQAKSAALARGSGKAEFKELDAGRYTVAVGPPDRFQPVEERVISVGAGDEVAITIALKAWNAIEVMFVGQNGKPLTDFEYRIRMPADNALRTSRTDQTGKARHDRVATGMCLVQVPGNLPWGAHHQEALARRK